jgi:hypothetical protein
MKTEYLDAEAGIPTTVTWSLVFNYYQNFKNVPFYHLIVYSGKRKVYSETSVSATSVE